MIADLLWSLAFLTGWFVVGIPVALIFGRIMRTADERELEGLGR